MQFYADKNHTKISREYITIKRWLRGRDISRIQKISDTHTIKKTLIEGSTACAYADKNHIKINREYTAIKH